uniref:Reverse transcriptase domain-containing protein n=1 Tax=Tanacetum cinerariifolium TaxID=118510 RepID=A0A6L2L7R8_TANCI|nr:reverse transcriptase domain-containing protein [Tanacetum cinerariifolium]
MLKPSGLAQMATKGNLGELGEEGLSFKGTKLNSILITVKLPEEGVRRAILEYRVTRPQKGSVTSFSPNNDHPTLTFVSQTGSTSRTININLNERPELEEKPYPSSLLEQVLASITQQMAQNQKKSSGKQNLSTNRRGNVKAEIAETKAKLKEYKTPLVGFFGEVSYPIGTINLSVTMGEPRKLRTIPMEFVVVKSHSPYNVILGQTGLRILGDVASTIHSMIKFPTANGIATMTTKRETLQECRRIEKAQGPAMEERTILHIMQASESEGITSKGKEGSQEQTDKIAEPDDII